MIHFVDLGDDKKWAELCGSIYEAQLPLMVELLHSFPSFGGKILEIGCSTGQVTEYLGQNCREVYALDSSPTMLYQARRRIEHDLGLENVTFQELKNFSVLPELNKKFDQIFILNSSFTAITDVQDQKHYLTNAYNALDKGGRLIVCTDMMKVDTILRDPSSSYHLIEVPNFNGVGRINVSEQVDYDEFSQLCETLIVADFVGDDGLVTERFQKKIVSRYTHIFEMVHLLKLSGFTMDGVYGDVYGEPLSDNTDKVIWVARR